MTYSASARYPLAMDRQLLQDRFGTLIRMRREVLDLSLRRAVASAHVPDGPKAAMLNQIELGNANPTVNTLADAASILSARWEIRLIGEGARPRDELRQALLDRVDSVIDNDRGRGDRGTNRCRSRGRRLDVPHRDGRSGPMGPS